MNAQNTKLGGLYTRGKPSRSGNLETTNAGPMTFFDVADRVTVSADNKWATNASGRVGRATAVTELATSLRALRGSGPRMKTEPHWRCSRKDTGEAV